MRRLFFLCGLLFSLTLMGQHVKQIPVGFQPISQATIDAAAADLSAASAASIYDIKMIFVTKMEGVTDRYQVYDGFGNDYLGFFNTPLDGSSGDTDDPAEVHQQLLAAGQAELGNLGDYSMFIIYTTILDLTDTNVTYDQEKYVLYGSSMTGCHKRRFEQIEEFGSKPTDYCVNNTIAVNDAYVSWYTGKLVEATGSEYVVTGTISFQNQIFCSEETLYVNDPHNGEIQNTSDFHPPIVLLVHPEMNVGTVSWSSPTTSATLFTSNTGEFNTLNFPRVAFEQFNTLVATWGGQQSSIEILPVNFQLVVDEDTLSQQGNAIGEITFTYKNNHANFPVENDIIVEVVGPTNVEGAPGEETVLPTVTGMEFRWTPNEEECDPYNIDHILLANGRNLTEHSKTTSFELKCAFEVEDFIVSVPYTMDSKSFNSVTPPGRREASAKEGESLYIVSNYLSTYEDLKRDVKGQIIWKDSDVPDADDYWKQRPQATTEFEPNWQVSPDGFYQGLFGFQQQDNFLKEYLPASFQTPPTAGTSIPMPSNVTDASLVFSQLFEPVDDKLGKAEVTVFDQNKYVALRFVHRDERRLDSTTLAPQTLQDIHYWVDNILDYVGVIDSFTSWINIPSGISGSIDLRSIVYNEEIPNSPLFEHIVKSTITGGITIDIPTSGDYFIIGPQVPFAGGAGLGVKVTLGLGADFDWKIKKTVNQPLTGLYQDLPIQKEFGGITPILTGQAGLVAQASGGVFSLDGGFAAPIVVQFDPINWNRNAAGDLEIQISGDVQPMEFVGYFELSVGIFGYNWTPFDGTTDPLFTFPENDYPFNFVIPVSLP